MSKRRNNSNDGDLSSFMPSFVKKPKLEGGEELPSGFGKQILVNDNGSAIDKTVKKKVCSFKLIVDSQLGGSEGEDEGDGSGNA
jgi:hypothetical protein